MPSERYHEEVSAASEWFAQHMAGLERIEITASQRRGGTDSIERHDVRALVRTCFEEWLAERRYELSYSQLSAAFFSAAERTGKLLVREGA